MHYAVIKNGEVKEFITDVPEWATEKEIRKTLCRFGIGNKCELVPETKWDSKTYYKYYSVREGYARTSWEIFQLNIDRTDGMKRATVRLPSDIYDHIQKKAESEGKDIGEFIADVVLKNI